MRSGVLAQSLRVRASRHPVVCRPDASEISFTTSRMQLLSDSPNAGTDIRCQLGPANSKFQSYAAMNNRCLDPRTTSSAKA